jgi:Na+/H+ antiporter NhaD/arsenite permease-like protein
MHQIAAAPGPFGADPAWVAVILFVLTYLLVIADRINRSIIAMLGAGAMIVSGVLSQDEAIRGIDFNTIALLTGMMVLVAIARRCGMFEYLAVWSAKKGRAQPWAMLAMLSLVTAVVSAFLDNVTTVLLIVPVTLSVTRLLGTAPYPFLFAEVFASNIGGTATLIGDPPNIMIGSLTGLGFNAFAVHLAPVILVVQAMQSVMIHLLWGRDMHATKEHRAHVMALEAGAAILDPALLKQSAAVLAGVILGFVLADRLGLEPATIAMAGAAALMLLDNWRHDAEKQSRNVQQTFGDVEWITIFFFIGLFIVVHAVEMSGLLALLANKLVAATGGDIARAGYAILWVSALLSALVDNIPFVATMIPLVKSMAPALGGPERIEPLWWCLALGACLGGNGTLIGAAANLTMAGLAERSGVAFGFVRFTLYGLPMMIVSLAICHVYVWLRYF